jgi:broad-specificity NMP kinase
MPTTIKAPVVWINGFPGTGKKTIADAMKQLDPNILVLDNHKLIDPVAAVISRDHPEYNTHRKQYRQTILQRHVLHPSSHDHLVVFTGTPPLLRAII